MLVAGSSAYADVNGAFCGEDGTIARH